LGSYGVTGLPTVFLIDKRGIVRKRIVRNKEENKEKLLRAIRELLAEEF